MSRLPSLHLAVTIVLALSSPLISAPVVVYDNTATPVTGDFISVGLPEGFWPLNQYGEDAIGDQISLAGTARELTRFELVLSSSQPTVVSALTLRLYMNDGFAWNGAPGAPGTPLWDGTLTGVPVDGATMVPFDLPQVPVPDVFSWTAEADSDHAGLATYDPPSIGSAPTWGGVQHAWDLDSVDQEWYALYFLNDPIANFGARVWAVPGPGCLALLVAGALALLSRRRR